MHLRLRTSRSAERCPKSGRKPEYSRPDARNGRPRVRDEQGGRRVASRRAAAARKAYPSRAEIRAAARSVCRPAAPAPLTPCGGALRASPGLSASRSMRIFRPAMEAARPPLSVRSALPGFSRMCELELSNKSDFNDFTPAGMNSDRGDFRFSGLVRQPLYVSCGAVSEQANIRKGRAYRMIRAKAAGCARANFALRANGTHRDGEGASGELYGRSCGARGRLTSGAVRRGRFVAGAGMPPPAARGGDMPGRAENPSDGRKRAAGRICGRRNPARAIGKAAPRMNSPTSGEGGREDDASRQSRSDKLRAGGSLPEPECTPPHGAATLPGRAENPSDGRKRAADRICGRRNPARAVGKAVPPDEFSDIRRRRERRRCVPAKPTGQAPHGRFVAGAGMPRRTGRRHCRGVPKVRQARERGPRGGSIPRRNASADAAIPHGRSERRRPG